MIEIPIKLETSEALAGLDKLIDRLEYIIELLDTANEKAEKLVEDTNLPGAYQTVSNCIHLWELVSDTSGCDYWVCKLCGKKQECSYPSPYYPHYPYYPTYPYDPQPQITYTVTNTSNTKKP